MQLLYKIKSMLPAILKRMLIMGSLLFLYNKHFLSGGYFPGKRGHGYKQYYRNGSIQSKIFLISIKLFSIKSNFIIKLTLFFM